jgi:hypothetical protein
VAVILRGIEAQGFPGKLAGLPVLIEGVLEEIFSGNSSIDLVEKLRVGHENGLRAATDSAACREKEQKECSKEL